MINLFIDTNVFLSFYHLTNEDVEELKKLAALIDNKEILLFLPAQVENEFKRNRGAKIADAMRKLKEAKFSLSFPLFAKDYKEYHDLRGLMEKADSVHSALIQKILDDAECNELSADEIVSTLFSKAKRIAANEELYLGALERVRLGNPPGKEGSMGDAVFWESLLKEVPNGEDVYVVSGDRDFRSQLAEGDVNEYLNYEWNDKKKSELHYFSKISDFFKSKFPNIRIASEVERDLLIEKLASSGSFASTHMHIAKLLGQSEFSPTQVEHMIEIPEFNNQVSWIVGDPDVHYFYASLLDKYGDKIKADSAKKLAEIVAKGAPEDFANESGF